MRNRFGAGVVIGAQRALPVPSRNSTRQVDNHT